MFWTKTNKSLVEQLDLKPTENNNNNIDFTNEQTELAMHW